MALRPFRLEPQFVPRIWGARTLAPLFPEKNSLREPVGEVWLTGNDCRFADGPFVGERLGDAWPRMGEEWAGKFSSSQQSPILAKFLFPESNLSIQVHPDDDYASRHEALAGGVGKTEMWYVVSARPGAEVRVGLKPSVTVEEFRNAITDGTAEDFLERIPVRAGDAIFVPAGTVHTIGPGMVLCEIQQNSDITYRLFDYHRLDSHGKPRELHIEKALDVIRFGRQCGRKVLPTTQQQEGVGRSLLVECPYFAVAKYEFEKAGRILSNRRLGIFVILEGKGTMRTESRDVAMEYSRAQTWMAPCSISEILISPDEPTTILRATSPAL